MKVIIVLAVSIGLPLMAGFLIRKFSPYRPNPAEPLFTPEEMRALARRFWWVASLMGISGLALTGIFTWVWVNLLLLLNTLILAMYSSGLYWAKPHWLVWFLPSLFLGLLGIDT
jgi:hypothetical protein